MSYDFVFKLIIVGEPSVGKSAICQQLTQKKFTNDYKTTIGIDFKTTYIMLKNGSKIKCQLWDTAGQEAYRSIIKSYYRNIAGAILVYDISDKTSFDKLPYWLNEINTNKNDDNLLLPIILIGNKNDKEENRKVTFDEGKQFAKMNNILFMETSAKLDNNIYNFIKLLSEHIYFQHENNNIKKGVSTMPKMEYEKDVELKLCCKLL